MLSPVRQAALRGQANGLAFGSGQFSLFAVYALAFWYGGTLVSKGEMTFESMLKVFFALIMSAFGLVQAQIAFPDLSAGSGAVTRSLALIDRAPAMGESCCLQLTPIACSEAPLEFVRQLRGVRFHRSGCMTQSLVMRSRSGTRRQVDAFHSLEKLAEFSSIDF